MPLSRHWRFGCVRGFTVAVGVDGVRNRIQGVRSSIQRYGFRIVQRLMHDLGALLVGSGLVAVGVLVAAVADRIRGLRTTRGPVADRPSRATRATATTRTPPRTVQTPTATEMMQRDVVAALVGAGYRKTVAVTAADACTLHDRATLETWTAAALRCAQGGLS